MKQYYLKALFLSIILISLSLRLFLLGEIPAGITNDEADIGYDAYSVLLTGKDQWGQFLPTTSFKGFGDYRLPAYTYLVVPTVQMFGLSEFSVRLPSAIFGTLSVVVIYFLAVKLFEREKYKHAIGIVSMALLGVSPWAMGLSRIGIESNVAIAFFLMAFYVFLSSKKNIYLLLLSFVLFASTVYIYTSYALFTPLSLVVLLWMRRDDLKGQRNAVIAGILIFVLLVIPLFVSRSATGVRISQVSFINSQDNVGILADLNDRRGSCDEVLPSVICKAFQNKPAVFASTFIQNYLNHFSLNFLFLNGTSTQYSILPPRSLFYTFELLLFIAGILAIFAKRAKAGYVAVILLLVSSLPDSVTGNGHFSRASTMMPFVILIEGFGCAYAYRYFKNYRKTGIILLILALSVTLYSVLSFFSAYFTYFPKQYSIYSQYGYKELMSKIDNSKAKYNKIYISKHSNDTKQYIYQLFYQKYDPVKFQNKQNVSYADSSDGWVSIDKIDNIHYTAKIPSEADLIQQRGKVLLVSHPSEFPKDIEILDSVKLRNGNIQFVFVDKDVLLDYYKNQSNLE